MVGIRKVTYQNLLNQHLKILKGLQYSSGLFAASKKDARTGYDKAWLRDNFYECLAFERIGDWETVNTTYRAILSIFKKHEIKIDYAIQNKPEFRHEYIHPRYNPETFDEYWEEWGNKQHDAIGAVLFMIGKLESRGKFLKDDDDRRIIQKLVYYLETIQYWNDPDSGMWEEDEEIHSSSVGACLAGLKMIKKHTSIKVPRQLIRSGERALKLILPRESQRKFTDLALLSLIYPYDIVNRKQRKEIITNVEYHLEKLHGVIRYKSDHYYNQNIDGISEEAEWTMGFSWLAIIYENMKDWKKAEYYIEKAKATINKKGEIPELYFSNSDKFNENSPLGWSESLFIVSVYNMNKKHL